MTLDELRQEWDIDTKLDDDLGAAAIKCSILHAKYLNELIMCKLRLSKIDHEIAEYRAKKSKYYRGEMTKAELEENEWQQWQYKTIKSDIHDMIEADSEFQKFQTRQSYVKTSIYFLESVLGEIKNRNFSIKSAIDWRRFTSGM